MTISEEVQTVLHRAFVGAREAGHSIITPEHLALELILEPETATYLTRCGTNLVAVEARLRSFLEQIAANAEAETTPTPAFQHVVGAAIQRTTADRREFVMLRDLFLAILDERKSVASSAITEATRDAQVFEELRTYQSPEERDEQSGR